MPESTGLFGRFFLTIDRTIEIGNPAVYTATMSPLGIKRFVAVILVVSPWIFVPSLFKDALFIILGILLYISTLDLRKKHRNPDHQETESIPVTYPPITA